MKSQGTKKPFEKEGVVGTVRCCQVGRMGRHAVTGRGSLVKWEHRVQVVID